jgi:hypothetical protein
MPELTQTFIETARLAPEAFPAAILAYLFALLEAGEVWAEDAALGALSAVTADPARLSQAAAACLIRWSGSLMPVRVFLATLADAEPQAVAASFPTFVELADPERQPFTTMRKPCRAPLVRLARRFPTEIHREIDARLSRGDPASVSQASRAIAALDRWAHDTVKGSARDLVSLLVRAKWIPAARSTDRDEPAAAARDLSDAVIELFRRDPAIVDDLLQKFRAGASADAEVRIHHVYHAVLRGRFRREPVAIGPAEELAFNRLMREAPKSSNWEVLREILQGVEDREARFIGLAQTYLDELLGTAIMMDERLIAFDAEAEPAEFWERLERRSHRDTLWRLRGRFVAWAASGAAANDDPSAFIKVLENIPEARDSFAACMIENAVGLAATAPGFNAILPALYAGLVAASQARRAAAVAAVGKLPANVRRHAPDLLFEAFAPALTDPYVIVHKRALHALRSFTLPEAFNARVQHAIENLVIAYGKDGQDHDLILEGIELLVGRHLSETDCVGRKGAYLVGLLTKLPKWSLTQHLRYLARELGRAKGFVELLVSMLMDPEIHDHATETILDALASLPNEVLFAHRAALATVPAGPAWETRRRVHALVELLSRAGAWTEAAQVADQAVAEIATTRRERPQRRLMELASAAAHHEGALAVGDVEAAAAAATRWRALHAESERDRDAA